MNDIPEYWKCEEDGYYITLLDCEKDSCNGEVILDEIISHYKQNNNVYKKEHYIIIDTYQLELNHKEYMKFRARQSKYHSEGYFINETF